MLKCIHEDSGIVTELVACVDHCLTLGEINKIDVRFR